MTEQFQRPWGFYEIIEEKDDRKVKKLTVYPGKRLSLQSHKHRCEHWIQFSGKGQAEIDNQILEIGENTHIFVNFQQKHRLINNSDTNLEIIEIQKGTYFGEDDIIRYQDDFGRV